MRILTVIYTEAFELDGHAQATLETAAVKRPEMHELHTVLRPPLRVPARRPSSSSSSSSSSQRFASKLHVRQITARQPVQCLRSDLRTPTAKKQRSTHVNRPHALYTKSRDCNLRKGTGKP